MKKLEPVTPGKILLEEFLKPMELSQYRVAKKIGLPAQRISEIVAGKRSITADTDLRLCRSAPVSETLQNNEPIVEYSKLRIFMDTISMQNLILSVVRYLIMQVSISLRFRNLTSTALQF